MNENQDRLPGTGIDGGPSKPLNPDSPATEAVDFERLREITANDEDLLREIIRQYLGQAEEIMAEMEKSILAGDHSQTCKLAHKLAGSSATCGMTGIVPSIRAMEALHASQLAEAIPLHQEATRQLLRIRQSLIGLLS